MIKPRYAFSERWDGHRAFLVMTRDDGAEVMGRVPPQILALPQSQKEWHMQGITEELYRKIDRIPYGKTIDITPS